jgi:AmmeMemoRadiSam system protein B/AmmeMemoRadiSam system protein A
LIREARSRRLAFGLALLLVPTLLRAEEPPRAGERAPAVAGRFYPLAAEKLEGAVRAYLADAVAPRSGRPLGLVAPHAGFIFSGQIAADAYRQAMNHDYDLVVILGVNHTLSGFGDVSVHQGSGYRTPLGLAEIDGELAARLVAADESFVFEPAVHRSEHSVEVQVPFVQVVFPGLKILPIVVGRPDPELCRRLGRALAELLRERRALIVASSDFSHYPAYEDAVAADRATLEAVARLDPAGLRATMQQELDRHRPGLGTCACGEAPLLAAMEALRALRAKRGCVISYANSGDTAVPDRGRVVGYGAVAFVAQACKGEPILPTPRGHESPGTSLNEADRQTLLRFARASIRRFLETGTAPLARDLPPGLERLQGAFVTLRKAGELRGCMGHRQTDTPVGQVVGSVALKAAFADPRFPPLETDEFDDVEIEISLLTPLEEVKRAEEIVIGRDGVFLRKGDRGAIYLPHVATQEGWNRVQMLDRLCQKGGLPAGCWRHGAELHTFRAEVFSEGDSG